jgi:hypothetical protein
VYRNEAAFSTALCAMLKRHYTIKIQRVESPITGVGIPDLYTRWPKQELWLELKRERGSAYEPTVTVHWRKGQQAWALEYYKVAQQCVLTLAAFDDGILIIPMRVHYTKGIVDTLGMRTASNLTHLCMQLSEVTR